MQSIAEIIKNMDMDEFVNELIEARNTKKAIYQAFWDSPLCTTMINDMLRVNQGFNAETFAYFPEDIKSLYNWHNISNEEIDTFINVMADDSIGVDKTVELEEDDDCMFDNYSFNKKGITVFIMHGQGTSINLTPQKI